MTTQLIDTYPVFVPNQVLTSQQLNGVRTYLDDQTRLSRTKLTGTGIIGGFKVTYNKSAGTITISEGIGISSDGFLLVMDKPMEYTDYGSFENKAKYPPWGKYEGEPAPTTRYIELKEKAGKPIHELTPELLHNKIVVLYMECLEKVSESCTIDNADQAGKSMNYHLKALLVNVDELKPFYNSQYLIDDQTSLKIKRLNSVLTLDKITDRTLLQNTYYSIIDSHRTKLGNALLKAYKNYHSLLGLKYALGKEGFDDLIDDCLLKNTELKHGINKLSNQGASKHPYPYQYVFAYLRDLTHTHQEFIQTASRLNTHVLKNDLSFPKHLMLGRLRTNIDDIKDFEGLSAAMLVEKINLKGYDEYRQYFLQSCITDQADIIVFKAQLLFRKIIEMIECFKIPENPELLTLATPGGSKSGSADQPIPYYYNLNDHLNTKKYPRLADYWDATLTLEAAVHQNLSYHFLEANTITDTNFTTWKKEVLSDTAKNPFDYDGCDFEFYRIEGHLGKPLKTVFEDLQAIKRDHNIRFNIAVLRFTPPSAEDFKEEAYPFGAYAFVDFVKKYPGMEHQGGVQKGGTFILLIERIEETDTVIADFCLPYLDIIEYTKDV